MNKKICALAAIGLLMTACSPKEEQKTEKNTTAATSNVADTCRNPGLQSTLQDDLQQAILAETRRLADPNWVDVDKIATAGSQLKLVLNSIQEKDNQCRGKLSILIPQNISQLAHENAPLFEMKNYDTVIEDNMGDVNFQFNGSTLSFPLSYTFKNGELNYDDESLPTSARALAIALLPYGVKDTLNVNGKTISRETALQIIQGGGSLATAKPAKQPNSEPAAASTSSPTDDSSIPTATPNTSVTPSTPAVTESPEQKALRQARAAENAARIAEQKAAERAAKAKAAREAAEVAKLQTNNTNTTKPAKTTTADTTKTPTEKPKNTTKNETKPKQEIDFVARSKQQNAKTDTKTEVKPSVNDDELDSIRKAHKKADDEIKSSWRNISPEIRKDLVEEQKAWEKQRNQRCRQAANAASNDTEASKLYMQCDTRMTKERVKNLQGYSISQ